ncbi:MAG: nitrilase-related carbon-nitrogen hydrolase [Actinomycetota bacterium]
MLRSAFDVAPSPARVQPSRRTPVRVGLVQQQWHPDPDRHRGALADGVRLAASHGARLVCLPELTLSPYFAITPDGPAAAGVEPERLPGGPTHEFAASLAAETDAFVHASLYEHPGDDDGLGYNTAICVAPDGALIARTRKAHLPVTAGYYEDEYFRPGDSGYPVVGVAGAQVGFPTCWDQWFPEVARAYALGGAEIIVYPTAIGSEPDHPEFDTEPLWEQVVRSHGIANGTFMVVPNRIGTEGPITFYGSSFISDPYGRIVVQAPRDEPAVLVADLDLDQRRDWLALFPLLRARRPETYGRLLEEPQE